MKSEKLLFCFLGAFTFSSLQAQSLKLPPSQVRVLEQMAEEFQAREDALQVRIRKYAADNGIEIHRTIPGGRVVSLVDFDATGKPVYIQTDNNTTAAATISSNRVYPSATVASKYNLAGRGFRIGEWDGGANRITHREYQGRATQADNSTMALSEHATHVGGTLIAGGVSANARGMSYQANLLAHDWTNDDAEMTSRASQGLLISNHSYGAVCGWEWNGTAWEWNGDANINSTYDWKFGFYDTQARDWDRIAYNAPNYLIVKSAGNARGSGPGNDPQRPNNGPHDCLPTYSTAKNILTVGAVNGISNGYSSPAGVVMSDFSSWGPTDDGRIKPDIVGCGVNVFSCGSATDNDYVTQSGTSMSGPSVSGSCLLLLEIYSNTHNQKVMKSATLKGLVIHTADECFNPSQGGWTGPDYRFGWGLMNTRKASDVILDDKIRSMIVEDTLFNQQFVEMSVVARGGTPLVATLCWTDYQGTPHAAAYNNRTPKLVNNLDLRLYTQAGSDTTFPWRLNPDSLTSPARKRDNNVDNVEKIELPNPVSGQTYKLRVRHKGTLFAGTGQPQRQPFSLIISGIVAGDTTRTCIPRQFMNAQSGILDDGSGSTKSYAHNSDCGWVINPADSNSIVQLIFRNFNVAAGDTLYAYSGSDASGTLIGKFSGTSLPDTILSTTTRMFLNFKSDASGSSSGWEVSYKALQQPLFNFTPASTTICEGDPVNFTATVTNGPTTGWNFAWSMPGAVNPSPIGTTTASATYAQAGVYSVSLTISNEAGPKTITKTNLITVRPGIAPNTAPFFDGFEATSFPNNTSNPNLSWTSTTDANPWQRSTLSPFEGIASARIRNATNLQNVRTLTSPAFNLSGSNVQKFVRFRYAYARTSTATALDMFRVLGSTDCGRTWTELMRRTNGTNPKLSTIGDTPSDVVVGTFIPEPSQYRQDSLSLNNLTGNASNISIRFEMTSDKGNFLYLDNVIIGGITTDVAGEIRNQETMVIQPNPGDGGAILNLAGFSNREILAELSDLQGRKISQYNLNGQDAVSVRMQDAFGLQRPGMYLLRIKTKDGIRLLKWLNN